MTADKLTGIKSYVKNMGSGTSHNYAHLERVKNNSIKLVNKLNLSKKIDLPLLEAICYLHDITYLKYPAGVFTYIFEGWLIIFELKKALPVLGIHGKEAEIIITACSKHQHSFPWKRLRKKSDLYTRLLQDADTLDLFHKERIIKIRKKWLSKAIIDFGIKNIREYLNFPDAYEKIYLSQKEN